MKKQTILLCLSIFLFLTNTTSAQKLKPAFDALSIGEYEEAEKLLNRATRKKIESPIANFALGKIFFDSLSGRKNNQRAYDFFQRSAEKFSKTDPKKIETYKTIYNIKPADCDSMSRLCALEDFYQARNNFKHYSCYDNDTLTKKFLAKYGKKYPDLRKQMLFSIDSLDYLSAYYFARCYWIFEKKDILCYKFFNDILNDKRPHPYADSILPAIKNIQKEAYDEILKTGYPAKMEIFRLYFDPTFMVEHRRVYNKYFYCQQYPVTPPEKDLKLFEEIKKYDNAYNVSKDARSEDTLRKKIKQFAPTDYGFQLIKILTQPSLKEKNWQAAINIYLEFRQLYPNHHTEIDKIIGILSESNPPEFPNVEKLPEEVNSPLYRENYAPAISPDMKKLYFVQDMDFRDFSSQEDMYMSEFKDGKWQMSQPIERFATLYSNEATEHIYPDDNQMVIFLNGKLYLSDKQDDGSWGAPYLMESKTDKYGKNGINGGYWQADAYFSADGQTMLFASIRKIPKIDTTMMLGKISPYNIDIYVCTKTEDGMWSMPQNIGPTINTSRDDRSPRLSPDLKTLFFTSQGHYGMGGYDIFMSKRLSDTSWTEWSEPVNLGRKINTYDDEPFFFNAYDGKTIFYSVYDRIENKSEIYSAQLPEKFRAETTSLLTGKINDSFGKPIHANISWEDVNTGRFLGTLKNDPVTGEFSITLPLGREYIYFVNADGYFPQSGLFDTKQAQESLLKNDSIALISVNEMIEKNIKIVIKNIFFEFNKADIQPRSLSQIKQIAKFLELNPDLKIEISGHTDKSGSQEYNQKLSLERAESVKNELVKLGIYSSQLTTKGYGSSKPISSNDEENRRVEFSIIKQ